MTLQELVNVYPEQVWNYEIIARNPYQPDIELEITDALVNHQMEQLILEYQ